MNLVYDPCLERMSTVKVATTVYSASKNFDLEKELKLPLYLFPDEKLEAIFKEGTSCQIPLPKLLQKKVLSLIKPMSFEVEVWRARHSNILDLNINIRKYLSWKSEGTIDRRATAIQLIRKNILPISKSFVLACYYCLREFAESFWIRMSESQRRQLFVENGHSSSIMKYYIFKFQGRDIELHVDDCHTAVALRFLLAQSSPEQRKLSLLLAVRQNSQDTHVLRYCLSQMQGKDLAKVFEYYPFEVLSCFLEWPWQSHFMNVANQLWQHLHLYDFQSFLRFILNNRIELGWTDFDYEELLTQFWCQSPSNFKDYVKQDKNFDKTLLISILNRNNIQLS